MSFFAMAKKLLYSHKSCCSVQSKWNLQSKTR